MSTRRDGPTDDEVLKRLEQHLRFSSLSHTVQHLSELLSWASRERPGPVAWLERVLGVKVERTLRVCHTLEHRLLGAVRPTRASAGGERVLNAALRTAFDGTVRRSAAPVR